MKTMGPVYLVLILVGYGYCQRNQEHFGGWFYKNRPSSEGSSCSRTIESRDGKITSPGYPQTYSNNLNCIYNITGNGRPQKISITVSKLVLETCDNCNCDWLSINYGPKICHDITFTEIYNFTDSFPILFRTDKNHVRKGFVINFSTENMHCANGQFGSRCNSICHCKGTPCDPQSGVCVHGCQQGWKGRFCDKEKMKATAKFYCFKISGVNTMVFRVNQRDTIYRSVSGIDTKGREMKQCRKAVFHHFNEGGLATVNVTQLNGEYSPHCGENKNSEDIVSWRFKFQEFLHTASAYDIQFEVECNFTLSDSLERTTMSNSEKPPNKTAVLTESKLSISFDVIDPFDKIPVTTAKLGQFVVLQAKLDNVEDFGITAIAPFNCSVSSLDNEYIAQFSDEFGCSVKGAQICFQNTNVTRWRSELFEAFTFPGHDKISFRCHFHTCFNEDTLYCQDMCMYSRTRKPSQHRERSKRQISKQQSTVVGTTLSFEGSTTGSPNDGVFWIQ